jgi:predicted lysophospholipase L1 biosynthesis ABC-type transport system permease subunit
MFPAKAVVGLPLSLTARTPQGDFLWETRTIVGVVSDVAYRSVRDPARPMIYVPLAQRADPTPQTGCVLAVRGTSGSAAALMRRVNAAVEKVNPNLTVTYETLTQQLDESLAQERIVALLSASFSALAVLLAGVGLYGVTSYATHLRRREIGIRIALGATTPVVITFAVARVLRLIALGIAVGLLVSLWSTRFVASLLFGVPPHDVSTFLAAALLLTTVGCLATWLPAQRAARVDPMIALRAE